MNTTIEHLGITPGNAQPAKPVPYRPSNGTEGECFFNAWCCHCARDKAMREGADFDDCDDTELCGIIADTFVYDVTDPKYPKEWIETADGPICTAFVESGEGVPEVDIHTMDLFT